MDIGDPPRRGVARGFDRLLGPPRLYAVLILKKLTHVMIPPTSVIYNNFADLRGRRILALTPYLTAPG